MKRSVPARSGSSNTLVSIIVAARNEEKAIRNLLERLILQSYSNYEIIIVDDRSEDRTPDIVRSFQDKRGNLRLIRITDLDPMMPPKKRALEAGIRESKGEILLFTDADC
ncbi:MAG: glycosyltransferase, partial [Ignavibacterium sp.]